MPKHFIRSLSVISLLLTVTGCSQIKDYWQGNTPAKYARMMEDPNSPDNRRVGIAKLVEKDFAKSEPYTTRYRQIFETDSSPLVRAMALRALNHSRDESASDLYIRALSDSDVQVRLEGAKALANMPDEKGIDALLKLLNAPDEDQDVRIAAARALRFYPRRDVARALVGVLDERNFGIAWQARMSLKRITGVDYAYDDATWLEYISTLG